MPWVSMRASVSWLCQKSSLPAILPVARMTYNMKIMPNILPSPGRPADHLVAVLAYDGVSTFELGIAVEIFGLPGMGPDWYRVLVCADRPGEPLLANGGVGIVAAAGLEAL